MVDQMIQIVKEAGTIILEAKYQEQDIEIKEGRSNFVTKYDKEVQNFLYINLKKLLPEATFIGEEDLVTNTGTSEYCFLIDPIDGTTNFIFDFKHSSISIALMKHNEIEIGIVFNPYLQEMFVAKKGEGAYLNDRKLHIDPLSLSKGIIGFGTSPYLPEMAEQTFRLARLLFDHSLDIRRSGSAALDLCYVAANRFVLFYELKLSPWDFAAASLILREAGGIITTMDGSELTFHTPTSVIAGNSVSYHEFYKIYH